MNSRRIVMDALNHKQPDELPIDFGATVVSGMHVSCVSELRDYYGLEKRPVEVIEPFQMLGRIDEELKQIIGVDTESISKPNNKFGISNEKYEEWRLESGLVVLMPSHLNLTINEKGDTLAYPHGDKSCGPSAKMPKGGYFFDAICRQGEIDDESLNPEDNLEEFKPLSDYDIQYLTESAKKARATGRAVVCGIMGSALGDISNVSGVGLKKPKGIRDVEEWYISTVMRQDYIHEIFQKQTEIAVENLKRLKAAVGDNIDIINVCGTDFGTQTSTFCSTDTFDELYMPYYKQLTGWIHANTNWKTFKHSCGAVEGFMEHFIEAGFDIINPVQCSARGMDPDLLKEKYGDRLTFWGGGVDTQKVLPFGTPKEVEEQVLQRCRQFSSNGGFVFNSTHNVQALTPVDNIVAMINAVHKFRKINS